MKHLTALFCIAAGSSVALAVPGGPEDPCGIMIVDSGNDRVVLADAYDGHVLDANWIDIAAAAAASGYTGLLTPIEAIEVGDEIWVSDQVADRIWRFNTSNRSYAGSIGAGTGELNNIRGMHRFGNTVYVAMGADSDIFGEGIITINATTGMITGSFNGRDVDDTSYFDINFYNGNLLISNSESGNDGLEMYSLAGAYLGQFVSSDGVTGIRFPEQIARTVDGDLLVGGFSGNSGVYMYDMFGNELGIVAGADLGTRGVYELGNGRILYTNGSMFGTDADGEILGNGSYRFVTEICGDFVPAPSSLALIGLGGLVATRRRRA